MALGYRYWTGISTLEDCGTAMQWYEQASQQGELHIASGNGNLLRIIVVAMEMFLRGPPLGATLPQTSTRLSDLVGGVYGPGASVASTGMNTLKPAIKAGIARAVGETWEDVLEYYQVCQLYNTRKITHVPPSSMPIAAKLTFHTTLGRSSTKGAFIILLAGSPQAAKVLVVYLEISAVLIITLIKLPERSGPAIRQIRSIMPLLHPEMKAQGQLGMQRRALRISDECISEGSMLNRIQPWRECGLREEQKQVTGSVIMGWG